MAEKPRQPLPRVLTLEEIVPAAHHHNTEKGSLIDTIITAVDNQTARFDNVIKPLADLENTQSGEKAVIAALKYCALDLKVQHASEEAEEIWKAFSAVVDRRVDLYNPVKAVKDRNESLDFESEKLLARMLMRYAECGYGVLEGDAIKAWLDTEEEIERLCTQFHRNLQEYRGGLWLADEELDGLEKRDFDRHPPRAEDGKRFFADMEDAWTVEAKAHSSETRKKMMVSFSGKLSENVPLFKRVIQLRDENARRLGYKSHAASRIPYRIADSTEWIDDLLKRLLESATPFAKRDFERVAAKKRDLDGAGSLLPWDVFYYRRLADLEEGPSNLDAVSEYFPLQYTVEAMLELFSDCLQLRLESIPHDTLRESTWSDDVQAWAVWDERPDHFCDFIGYLYADLLERPELGHGIHDLLARTKYARFHGYEACLEYGEAIGTMLENWCWIPDEIKAMSCHYTRIDARYREAWQEANPGRPLPPERIPDELLEKRFKCRTSNRIQLMLHQLLTSLFDMAVHNPPAPEYLAELDEGELYEDIFERIRFWRHPKPSYGHVDYGHLLFGYDAGYYAYLAADVFASDMFQQNFAEDPRSREAWGRFRTGILECGGSRDELAMLTEFLGRAPTVDAFLGRLGLADALGRPC